MIIQCPRCSTRWRVGDSSATENPVFKCGRCHHVFPQFPGAPPPPERAGTSKARSAPPEPDNLEFIFPRRAPALADDAGAALAEAPDVIAQPLRDIVHDPPRAILTASIATSPQAPPPRPTDATSDPSTDLAAPPASPTVPHPKADAPPAPSAAASEPMESPFELDLDDDESPSMDDAAPAPASRVLDVEALMRASARTPAIRSATQLLLVLVVLFALLAVVVRAHPERADAWLGRVPLLGKTLGARSALSGRITLSGIQGGYQRLRTGRRIFVITGKAINNSLVAVERIEVEGALYAASGAVDRKVISTGNRTTLKLRDLSESEIALLQNLDARQEVAPGGTVDFGIVFLEPPRDLREFSSRVLSARSTGRASAPQSRPPHSASVG